MPQSSTVIIGFSMTAKIVARNAPELQQGTQYKAFKQVFLEKWNNSKWPTNMEEIHKLLDA